MANPRKTPDDPVQAVAAKMKEDLAPVEKKREQGKSALIRRKHAEYQRAGGLGDMSVDERLMRADFEAQLLKSGIHITIDALKDEIEIRERASAEYREAQKQIIEELDRIEPEYQAIAARRLQLQRLRDEVPHRSIRENAVIAEKRRELEAHLVTAEALGRGENVKLWKPANRDHPLRRQSTVEAGVADVVGWENMSRKQADKIAQEFNEKLRRQADEEWNNRVLAREIGIPVGDLKYLQPQNGPREAA
jgi:hypothetical protein